MTKQDDLDKLKNSHDDGIEALELLSAASKSSDMSDKLNGILAGLSFVVAQNVYTLKDAIKAEEERQALAHMKECTRL